MKILWRAVFLVLLAVVFAAPVIAPGIDSGSVDTDALPPGAYRELAVPGDLAPGAYCFFVAGDPPETEGPIAPALFDLYLFRPGGTDPEAICGIGGSDGVTAAVTLAVGDVLRIQPYPYLIPEAYGRLCYFRLPAK